MLKGGTVGRVERGSAVGSGGGTANHTHDLDARLLHDNSLVPEGGEVRVIRREVIEMDDAALVDVERTHNQMRQRNALLVDERQHRDGVVALVVRRLEVNHQTGQIRRLRPSNSNILDRHSQRQRRQHGC